MVCACTLFRDSYMLTDRQYLKSLEILILLYVFQTVHGLLVAAQEQCIGYEDLGAFSLISFLVSEDGVTLLQVFHAVTDDAHE